MSELLDRFHAEAVASERNWSAEEVAARVLRMKAGGGVAALVRAVLGADGRFEEMSDGSWSVRRTPPSLLAADGCRLCWFEPGAADAVRVHLASWKPGRTLGRVRELDGTDPSSWFARAEDVLGERWATLQPAACSRWLWNMDRRWALGETTHPPLDLQGWVRIALLDEGVPYADLVGESAPGRLSLRWGLGRHGEDGAGRLRLLAEILDHLKEVYPDWTEAHLERARAAQLEVRPLDFARFGFDREALERVPAVPGVYRLRAVGGELIYVGKALDLGRRLREHFRPLPPEPTRREEMLAAVRHFEYEELPSELEALVREHRAIVEEAPSWNTQVEVHPPRRFPTNWRWPLVYLAPGEGVRRTLVVLGGANHGALLAVDPSCLEEDTLVRAVASLSCGPGEVESADVEGDLLRLRPPEAWLALRYYARFRDRIDRIDPLATPALPARIRELVTSMSAEGPRELRDA